MSDKAISPVAQPSGPSADPTALPISATVICQNEEACIGKCLASLEGVAEIIVVDSGSTDETLTIVDAFARRGFPIRVFHQPWLGYAAQKQFALDQATQPWVLSVDADEWLDDELRGLLSAMASAEGSVGGWMMRRALTLYGRKNPVSLWTRPERILRLARRGKARFDPNVLVHEGLIVEGDIRLAPAGLLRHERGLPLDVQIRKEAAYARLKAEQRLQRGQRPSVLKLIFSPPLYFLRILFWNRLFLSGWSGLVHAGTGAAYSFLTEALHFQLYSRGFSDQDRNWKERVGEQGEPSNERQY
jgi:glycosyltransferase involved in cell wall biosynthesis